MIYITMPVLHHKEVLRNMTREAVASINTKEQWSLLVEDGEQSLSHKWNHGLKMAIKSGAEFCWIVNNDVLCNENTLDALHLFARENPDYAAYSVDQVKDLMAFKLWQPQMGVTEDWFNWSFFMVRPSSFVKKYGFFDENIGQGPFQDVDKYLQIQAKGGSIARYLGACIYHASDTSRREGAVADWNEKYMKNKLYVEQKWNVSL